MFRSKNREIVVPQAEHQQLAGALALLWGNETFAAPALDRRSLVMGIGLHDRGYRPLDDLPIGGMSEEAWFAVARRGFSMPCTDVVADTIIKYHIRRLASHSQSPERQALVAEFSRAIAAQLRQHGLAAAFFERVDRITELCDRIAFDFCLDAPASGEVAVYAHDTHEAPITVRYHIADGLIGISPWPLAVSSYENYLVGYRAAGYPITLDPFILPYRLEPM